MTGVLSPIVCVMFVLLSLTVIAELVPGHVCWWEPKTKNTDGEEHGHSLEDVERPLVCEGIAFDTERELNKAVDRTYLSP
jgi:hypothetical protein